MTVIWEDLAAEVRDQLGISPEALWSLVFTAQSGVFELALTAPLDDDLSLSDAATDLALALDEFELAQPELMFSALAVDLGPVRLDDVNAYRAAILGLLDAAAEQIVAMRRRVLNELDTSQLLALASAATMSGSARRRVNGARDDGANAVRRSAASRRWSDPGREHGVGVGAFPESLGSKRRARVVSRSVPCPGAARGTDSRTRWPASADPGLRRDRAGRRRRHAPDRSPGAPRPAQLRRCRGRGWRGGVMAQGR